MRIITTFILRKFCLLSWICSYNGGNISWLLCHCFKLFNEWKCWVTWEEKEMSLKDPISTIAYCLPVHFHSPIDLPLFPHFTIYKLEHVYFGTHMCPHMSTFLLWEHLFALVICRVCASLHVFRLFFFVPFKNRSFTLGIRYS